MEVHTMSAAVVSVPATPAREPVTRADGMPHTAACIAVACWAIVVISIITLVVAHPEPSQDMWFFTVDAMVGCVYGLVAGVTLSRRRHIVPAIIGLTAIGGAVAAFAYAYGELGLVRSDLPLVDAVARLNSIAWVPGTLALFLVVPWLVRDHPLGWFGRTGLTIGTGVTVLFTASSLVDRPISMSVLSGLAVCAGVLTAVDVTWRWARGPVDERPGLGWLAIGVTIMALSFLPLALPAAEGTPIWSIPALHLAAQAFFPAAVLVAVLRQRLWGIDLAVSRAVLAGLLTFVLVLLYALVAALLAALLPGEGAGQVVAAAVVVVAVQPSRLWLQRRVDRLVHGAQPEQAVRRLGQHLGSATSTDELLDGLVRGVGEALRLESVELVVDGEAVAAHGSATSEQVAVPLVHRGRDVGELRVTAPPGESLGARSRQSLQDQASLVAAGAALAQASRELDEARDRLTSARLEERRLIRRELHDGLGPSLAGIRLGLQAARNLVPTDADAAAELLGSLQAELDTRVDDVRQLSRSLLPPVLDELGLAAALQDLTQRQRESGLDLRLRLEATPDELTGLSRDRAAAAYAIVAEAVTNVVRHSGAGACRITVRGGLELSIVVQDDGAGRDPAAPAGVGSRSMRERAQEQGGSLSIGPASGGGTRVEARLPWDAP
jgi:signal transduction histidine kinase